MRAALDRQAFCRVTLLTPRHRVDVALPADVPLAELAPMVRELLGPSRAPVGWCFSRVTGGPLPGSATLDGLGVPDGELLRLGPPAPVPPAPVVDDPVEAVAARAGSGKPAGPRVRAAAALAGSVLAAVLLCLTDRDASGTAAVVAVLLAVAGMLACLATASAAARLADVAARRAAGAEVPGPRLGGAVANGRPGPAGADGRAVPTRFTAAGFTGVNGRPAHPGDAAADDGFPAAGRPDGQATGFTGANGRPVSTRFAATDDQPVPAGFTGFAAEVAAICAVAFAAAAGWIALPGPPGAGQLLVAAAVAGTVAAVGQVVVRVVSPVLVGIVAVAAVLAGAALLRLWLEAGPAALAAGAAALALAAGPTVPRVALRLAGLPQPSAPTDVAELVTEDRLDRLPATELADRTDLARGFLAGLTGACAAVAAGAAVPIAAAGGWSGPVTALVVVTAVGLRVRGFADVAPARACLVAGLAGAAGVAAVLAVEGSAVVRMLVAAAVGAGAVAAVALTGREDPVGSPTTRRAVALLESTLLAASVPLALAVMDVYSLVRGL